MCSQYLVIDHHAVHVKDSIHTEYHPQSQRPTKVDKFEEYNDTPPSEPPDIGPEPWSPFGLRTDFEFAEIALAAALTKDQVDSMIQLIGHVVQGQDSFNLKSHHDLCATWNAASALATPVATLYKPISI